MARLRSNTFEFIVDSEQEAMDLIEEYKEKQLSENYTLTKYNTVYKSKKDRKTHEIIEEYWVVTVTKKFEVE